MDHLKSDECGGEGREGREMFSLHEHVLFFIAISTNTFIRVQKSSYSSLLLMFFGNIRIIS